MVVPAQRGVNRGPVAHAFAFRSLTSQGDPRTLRRAELAHRYLSLCALLEFSQSRLFQPCFFGQFQPSFRLSPG